MLLRRFRWTGRFVKTLTVIALYSFRNKVGSKKEFLLFEKDVS